MICPSNSFVTVLYGHIMSSYSSNFVTVKKMCAELLERFIVTGFTPAVDPLLLGSL